MKALKKLTSPTNCKIIRNPTITRFIIQITAIFTQKYGFSPNLGTNLANKAGCRPFKQVNLMLLYFMPCDSEFEKLANKAGSPFKRGALYRGVERDCQHNGQCADRGQL